MQENDSPQGAYTIYRTTHVINAYTNASEFSIIRGHFCFHTFYIEFCRRSVYRLNTY